MSGCPKCRFSKGVKNGYSRGKQRSRCKSCGFQYTRRTPRGRLASEKTTAILFSALGLSRNSIARMFKVSTPAVLRGVRLFAEKTEEKPNSPEGVLVELDEMWHFVGSKKTSFGSGKRIVAIPVNSLTGNVGLVIEPRSHD